jgi:pimeloyl-ACP methyl ester carboxylesterase
MGWLLLTMRILVLVIVLSGLLALALGGRIENALVYHPEQQLRAMPAEAHVPFDEVWLTSEDGVRLHAWHVHAAAARALVVVCHGNAGNISHRLRLADALAREGLDTLLFDYRGYGRSAGSPSEEGLYRDGEAARRWAEGKGLPVVLYGESLGGAVAVELAVRRAPALLVVQSSFTSLPALAARLLPLGAGLPGSGSRRWRRSAGWPARSWWCTVTGTSWCPTTWASSCSPPRPVPRSCWRSLAAATMTSC